MCSAQRFDIVKLNKHYYIVTGGNPNNVDQKWQIDDEKAREIFERSIDDDQTIHIIHEAKAVEMWRTFEEFMTKTHFK